MDKITFTLLYEPGNSQAAFRIDLCQCPYKKCDIEIIEKVQKRATKLIISLKHLSYNERLKQLQLPTLKYRRLRGDMIKVFKMVHNYYDVCATVKFFFIFSAPLGAININCRKVQAIIT